LTLHTGELFVFSSPSVANGVVYAATLGAYAYDALTGALLWRSPTGAVNAAPALVDGVLYVADFSGTMRAYALPASAR
jgi:outer membrane protein assembly factor BamB